MQTEAPKSSKAQKRLVVGCTTTATLGAEMAFIAWSGWAHGRGALTVALIAFGPLIAPQALLLSLVLRKGASE